MKKEEASAPCEEDGLAGRPPCNGAVTALVITMLVQAVAVVAVLAPAVIGPAIVDALGLPAATVGIFISLVYLAAICSALYSETLVSRWGAIRISQAGLLLCAAGVALITTQVAGLALVGAVVIGLGYGPITPASSHILIRTTPPHRLALVFSIKQTGVPLGGIIAGLLVPPQEVAFGWSWALLSVSLGCVVMSLLAQRVRGELDHERGARLTNSFFAAILRPIRLVASVRGLRVLAVCSFVFAGVQLSLTTYLSSFLNLALGWSLLAAGVALSVTQAAGMVGRIVWGAIADAGLEAQKTLILLTGLMIAGCIGIATFTTDTHRLWIFACLVVFGASAIGWNGVFLAQVARVAPLGQASLATGGTLAFAFFGTVFWAPLFGLLVDAAGSYQCSFLSFCLPLLICLGYLVRGRFS